MKMYAQHKPSGVLYPYNVLGDKWYPLTAEKVVVYPSGRHNTITINGIPVKEKYCNVIYVFDKV